MPSFATVLGVVLLSIFSLSCEKNQKVEAFQSGVGVVYGEDSRQEVGMVNYPLVQRWSPYSVALFERKELVRHGLHFELRGPNLRQSRGLCSGQRFAEQKATADCSGLLIDERHVLTAGHCVFSAQECAKYAFVFGYQVPGIQTAGYQVSAQQVFSCQSVLAASRNPERPRRGIVGNTGADFSIVELDRPVTVPFQVGFDTEDSLKPGDPLFVLGYPSGLPKKFAQGQVVRNNLRTHYVFTDLDTFEGNSGAPVFNSRNGLLEGILIQGAQDYEKASGGDCQVVHQCAKIGLGCEGEQVFKISHIKKYLEMLRK